MGSVIRRSRKGGRGRLVGWRLVDGGEIAVRETCKARASGGGVGEGGDVMRLCLLSTLLSGRYITMMMMMMMGNNSQLGTPLQVAGVRVSSRGLGKGRRLFVVVYSCNLPYKPCLRSFARRFKTSQEKKAAGTQVFWCLYARQLYDTIVACVLGQLRLLSLCCFLLSGVVATLLLPAKAGVVLVVFLYWERRVLETNLIQKRMMRSR